MADRHALDLRHVAEVVFEEREGGEVYEVSRAGEKGHWATVVAFEPPGRLVLAWNVAESDPVSTEVEIRFTAEGAGTRVDLEHRGWERLTEPAEARKSYNTGWDLVLGRYVDRAGR